MFENLGNEVFQNETPLRRHIALKYPIILLVCIQFEYTWVWCLVRCGPGTRMSEKYFATKKKVKTLLCKTPSKLTPRGKPQVNVNW